MSTDNDTRTDEAYEDDEVYEEEDAYTGETYEADEDDGTGWTGWVNILLGLWILVTPFFLAPEAAGLFDFGETTWLAWSNIGTGLLIAALAAYTAYAN